MIVTRDEFEKYSGVYTDENNTLPELYIQSAENILFNYLGYDPTPQNYRHVFNGNGESYLRVGVKPIWLVAEVRIGNTAQDLGNITFDNDTIYLLNGTFPEGKGNITVDFSAGYNEIPAIMKMTVLRIATLLQSEGDSNIGITSKSFEESGTRVFQNYTNYDKYLIQCSKYKLF